jgi:predicted permease
MKSVSREREYAIRIALGASPTRMLFQSVVESSLVSTGAGVVGGLIGAAAIKALWHPLTRSLPLTGRIHFDLRVICVLGLLTVITSIIVGLFPGVRATGPNIQRGLRGGITPLQHADQYRLHFGLIAAQLTITMVLLAGAGLLVRTVLALRQVPLGFSEENALTGGIIIPPSQQSGDAPKLRNTTTELYTPLLESIRHIPGVESAALSSVLPMRSDFEISMRGKLDGRVGIGLGYIAEGRIASSGLPQTFGIAVLQGRFFDNNDTASSSRVVVVNNAFASKYLPDEDPIGHTFGLGTGKLSSMRIVGVIGDVKQGDVTIATKPEVYLCLSQVEPGDSFYDDVSAFIEFAIRSHAPPGFLYEQLKIALNHVNADAISTNVMTAKEAVEDSFGSQTLMAHLISGCSVLSLLIAAVGLYSTVAFSVAKRRREFGVRLAVGAPPEKLVWMVVRQAMRPVFVGLIVGNIVVWFFIHLIKSYLFGVASHDFATTLIVSLILIVTGFFAGLVPARSAASVDPLVALREE